MEYRFWGELESDSFCCYQVKRLHFALPERNDEIAGAIRDALRPGSHLIVYRPQDADASGDWVSEKWLEEFLWDIYRMKLSS